MSNEISITVTLSEHEYLILQNAISVAELDARGNSIRYSEIRSLSAKLQREWCCIAARNSHRI